MTMSRFYATIHVRATDREDLLRELAHELDLSGTLEEALKIVSTDEARQLRSSTPDQTKALVSPAINQWVTFFPGDVRGCEEFTRVLSGTKGRWATYLWLDPERAWGYTMCKDGEKIDMFVNDLVYFDGRNPEEGRDEHGGEPRKYESLLHEPNDVNDLINLLQISRKEAMDQNSDENEGRSERISNEFDMFREALGLPPAASDYMYLMQGETDDVLRWDQFLHITIEDTFDSSS